MSKLDTNTLGWTLRELYNKNLHESIEEYKLKLGEALAEDNIGDISLYSKLIEDEAEQIKAVSELDSYGFLIELYKTMHTLWEEHLEYLREQQLEKMEKKESL